MFFDAYGFLHVPGLLAADVDELSATFDQVFADPAHPPFPFSAPGHRGETQWALGDFVDRAPGLGHLPTHPRLLGLATDLLGPGCSLVGSDASIYCCETEWHYDAPTRRPDHRHVKLAVYLDPIEPGTGAPRFLPGSHQLPAVDGGALQPYLGFDGQTEARTGLRGEDLPHWSVPLRPGDVIVWDFRVMHASFGSSAPRRQFALNFGSAEPMASALADLGPDAAAFVRSLSAAGVVGIDGHEVARLRRESTSYRRLTGMDITTPDEATGPA